MSRFFAGSDSDTSSSSSSESEQEVTNVRAVASKFGNAYESSSESEDEVRVVRSQKDRTWENMMDRINKLKNAKKNSDWNAMQEEFDAVGKLVDRNKMIILQHGLPNFYVKMLGETEDFVNAMAKDKETVKKMKPAAERSFNRLKMTVKKFNKRYETEITDFRANPEKYVEAESEGESSDSSASDSNDSESESDSDSDSDSDSNSTSDSSSDSDSDSDSESDDSIFGASDDDSSDEEIELRPDDAVPVGKKRDFWLKKSVETKSDEINEEDEIALKKKRAQLEMEAQEKKKKRVEALEESYKRRNTVRTAEFRMTAEQLDKRVAELVSARGRKASDVRVTIRLVEVLTKVARELGAKKEIPLLMHLISITFDSNHTIDDYLDLHTWRFSCRCIHRVLTLLDQHKNYVLRLASSDDVEDMKNQIAQEEVDKNSITIVGGLESFLTRLQDDYTKSLQQINSHTKEYIVRLSDEALLIDLSQRIQAYYTRIGDYGAVAAVALTEVEYLYYKHDTMAAAVARASVFTKQWGSRSELHPASLGKIDISELKKKSEFTNPAAWSGNATVTSGVLPSAMAASTADRLDELCSYIFKHGTERLKTRALLCTVYHHALHDRYHKARDMFLLSHIQDNIDKADIMTQILYNRALATLGLCAFRLGYIQKAFDCLSNLSGHVKELLAQGLSKWNMADRDPDQERVEKRRQMPYHMHINPDLLECCFLISAMFLDLPTLVKYPDSSISQYRAFRKYFSNYNRQIFTGPPENTREHVLSAAKALISSDWQKASDLLTGLDVWKLIPGEGADMVRSMLRTKVKDEGLRLYMLTAASNYDSMSVAHVCSVFECESTVAKRIINKMIFSKEISGAWEIQNDVLVLYRSDATPLQQTTLHVAEKLCALVESNERVLDPMVGAYGYKDDRQQQRGERKYDSKRPYKGDVGNNVRMPYRVNTEGQQKGKGGRGGARNGQGKRAGGRGGQARGGNVNTGGNRNNTLTQARTNVWG